jgi:hypothetical protein
VPITPEVQARILAAIKAKVPTQGDCAVCGNPNFTLVDGFISLGVAESAVMGAPAPRRLPSAALVCSNCGNTVFLNLFRLGLADLAAEVTNTDV